MANIHIFCNKIKGVVLFFCKEVRDDITKGTVQKVQGAGQRAQYSVPKEKGPSLLPEFYIHPIQGS